MALNIEAAFRAAEERGDFDNLPGHGKPLPEDEFKDLPEELRMTYRILKSTGHVPGEISMMKAIEELRNQVLAQTDPDVRTAMQLQLRQLETELKMKIENP